MDIAAPHFESIGGMRRSQPQADAGPTPTIHVYSAAALGSSLSGYSSTYSIDTLPKLSSCRYSSTVTWYQVYDYLLTGISRLVSSMRRRRNMSCHTICEHNVSRPDASCCSRLQAPCQTRNRRTSPTQAVRHNSSIRDWDVTLNSPFAEDHPGTLSVVFDAMVP